jgi:bifunctional non-homologous end joining protein LigD
MKVGRRTVALTRPDKVLFPADGITKRQLAEYYAAVAPAMVPHVRGRALTMERYPDGIDGHKLFQKNIPAYFPDWIERVTVKKAKGTVTHVVANEAATLVYLANQACITPHLALAKADHGTQPDQVLFDLDPSTDEFEPVRATALELRELLSDAGLTPFCKTTGSKGLHVMAPIKADLTFEDVYGFASSVIAVLIARHPDLLTTEFMKADRRGRIFMDIGRNQWAQTAVAPYAVRARPGAPVATPIEWSEVEDRRISARSFTIADVPARLQKRGDPWREWRTQARSLKRAAQALVG